LLTSRFSWHHAGSFAALHILIIKMSSMGDVIHTLPALTDAMHALPDLRVDWVVEEAFTEIPGWHPAVDRVIPVAIRRWRKNWLKTWQRGELGLLQKALKQTPYDLVIDAQGLLKSAAISALVKAPVSGLDSKSSKEPVSSVFYRHRFEVSKAQHAVQRVRQLFAKALDYSFDSSAIDYGIHRPASPGQSPDRAIMFLHGTTWNTKHWPEPYWRELARILSDAGYEVRLPWGNDHELERAKRIANGLTNSVVLDKLSLSELAGKMHACAGVVAVDTGLGHLAAALNRPTVSIYGATNPSLSGTFGYHQLQLKSDLPCAPCLRRNCQYRGPVLRDQFGNGEEFTVEPPCFRSAPPAEVFSHLQRIIVQAQEAPA
jgi:heptosyltransferase I